MNNGNYDSGYSGLQPITDSLLSGSEARKSDESVKCEVKSENGPLLDFKSAFSDLDTKNDMSFFHETLDLSHDDIQRTLTANLPACSQQDKSPNQTPHTTTHRPHSHNDLNMDYINNTNHHPAQSSSFDVNLEAFDNYILSDFPELGQYEGSNHSNGLMNNGHPGPMLSQAATNANNHLGTTIKTRTLEYRENLVSITDYSPGWAYTDGSEKILVTGPWYSQTKPYQILFDGVAVATTLVQSGVLRCFCPEHAAGSATLQVACEGTVISEAVIFEYKITKGKSKRPATKVNREHQESKDKDLKNTLLNKLESLDICTVNAFMEEFNCQQEPFSDFEDLLVTKCQKLTSEDWTTEEGVMSDTGSESTLLHHAASFGYTRLVCSLLHWAAEHPGRRLGREVDALAKDGEGFTPLMRACANGKKEVATILYHWNSAASRIKNLAGDTCADVAGKSSCPSFKLELEKLEVQKTKDLRESEFCKPRPEFIKPVKKVTKKVIRAPSLEGYLNIPVTVRRSPSPLHIRSGSPGVRSLRGASPQIEATVGRKLKLIKRPSVDSGINLDSQAVKNSTKDIRQLSKNDRSLSLPASGFGKKEALLRILTSESGEKEPANKEESEKNDENPGSPFIDVEGLSSDEEEQSVAPSTASKKDPQEMDVEASEDDQKVLTLAEHFLAAMPDRFKLDASGDNEDDDTSILTDCSCSQHGPDCCSQSDDLGIESMADDLSVDFEFNFEEACQSYRDVSTPTSSHSPASFTMESPRSYNLESPSPCVSFSMDRRSPPTTAELQEFLQASVKCEKDLSNLTLSEREQRELYQAAQIIQKAYRSYKGRKKSKGRGRPPTDGPESTIDNGKEAKAAVVIQNYYRRYKQYIYWKQMSKAATLIQNKYRTYCEHKRFKKSQEAATCIQKHYRSYKELQNHSIQRDESTPTAGLKRTYSQRRQHQAARKIQQFMKQTHLKLQNARVATRVASERPPTSACLGACPPSCLATPTTMATPPTSSTTHTATTCFPIGATTTTSSITSQYPDRLIKDRAEEMEQEEEEEEDDHPEPKSCKKNYARN